MDGQPIALATTELHLCIEADGRVAVTPVEGPAANDVGIRAANSGDFGVGARDTVFRCRRHGHH